MVTPPQGHLSAAAEEALRAQPPKRHTLHRLRAFSQRAEQFFRHRNNPLPHAVVIVDEFTGRLMPGRRFSDGLPQALEAKENVTIERENQTLATITFQNYFRLYSKLSGMTGTAETEKEEFKKIYNLV